MFPPTKHTRSNQKETGATRLLRDNVRFENEVELNDIRDVAKLNKYAMRDSVWSHCI